MKDVNTNSKKFWDNYVEYWENKVSDANNNENAKDKTSTDAIAAHQIAKLNIKKDDIFLDYGCGSGRLYPYYLSLSNGEKNYYGTDISSIALSHMKETFSNLESEKLKETDGITIPWKDNMFDKAICYAVFDACDQEQILSELMRVLKRGGQLYITGKNYNYYDNDNEAYVAEVNARKKGHPNSFTNLKEMISQLQNQGAIIRQTFLFERRGDSVNDRVADIYLDDKFYEWQIIVEKNTDNMFVFDKFSDLYSDTFRRKERECQD